MRENISKWWKVVKNGEICMILGKYRSNLTSGKRVAVPSKIRSKLGKTYILAKWYENCLVLVSEDAWEELLSKLTGRAEMITKNVRDTDRFILGSAFELEADSQGRIILPPDLMKYAQIEDAVVFLGLGNRVEVWSEKVWEKREEYISENAAAMMEELSDERR